MEYSILVAESFRRDLIGAIGYLVDELGSPMAAGRLLDAVDNAIDLMGRMPEMHAVSSKPLLGERGFRECLVEGYVIVYRIEGKAIAIQRLFHQSQDYERLA